MVILMNDTFEPFTALVVDGALKGQTLNFEHGYIQNSMVNKDLVILVQTGLYVTYFSHMVHVGTRRYMVASIEEVLPVECEIVDMLIDHAHPSWFQTDMLEGFSDSSRRYRIISPVV